MVMVEQADYPRALRVPSMMDVKPARVVFPPGLIRYFAVRDVAGAYRGCLEVTEDVTENRKLTGERRLLEWGAE